MNGGRAVVREMNRLGMIVNVAHASKRDHPADRGAEQRSGALFSHGGSRHFVDIPRNLSDDAARKIAAKGGVVCLQFGNTFSNRAYYDTPPKGVVFGAISAMFKRFGAFQTIQEIDPRGR